MSEKAFIIKLNIASAWADDENVLGWAINCIGDQVAEGKTTGPVWRGGNGPGVDDVGTFEILRPTEPRFAPPEKDLPTLLDEIGSLAGKAYTLAMEQKQDEPDEELTALAVLVAQAHGEKWLNVSRRHLDTYFSIAKSMIDAGYGKVNEIKGEQ